MKNVFTLLLVSSVVFLSSCGNGSNDPLPIVPPADSSTSNSYISSWFVTDTFFIRDLALNGVAYIGMHASDIYNATDSVWECRVQLIDAPKNQMEINIVARGSSPTGVFSVFDNSSTLTNYAHGENKTYSIGIGSIINVTQNTYPIKGNMSLRMYFNHDTTYANDSFSINHN